MRVIDRQGKDFDEYFKMRILKDFKGIFELVEIYNAAQGNVFSRCEKVLEERIFRHINFVKTIENLGYNLSEDYIGIYQKLYSKFLSSDGLEMRQGDFFFSSPFFILSEQYLQRNSRQLEFGI
ncbi:hypothetical protein HYT25_04020 [Candidatus Pacearchaeota archaeon]|nr:hypothetical protein [Candidatus Pacearchaeota archaeon]